MNATSIFLTSLLAGGLSNGMGQIQLQSTATITPDSKKLVLFSIQIQDPAQRYDDRVPRH